VGALAIVHTTTAAQPDGVVSWGIQRHEKVRRVGRRQANVAGTVEEVVQNQEQRGGYFATAEVGNPGQAVTIQLDTGSSDVWVPSSQSQVCQKTGRGSGCSLGSCTLISLPLTFTRCLC
jgi:predicted aspartyl protease